MNGQLHRVVVTGIGVVSPVGNTLEETWNNLVNGVCGIAPITLFDTTDYKAKVAGEVKNFEPRDYMTKQEILRSDRFTQLAVAAAAQAVEESGVIGTVDPARIGVYFGSGIGGINTMTKESPTWQLARSPSVTTARAQPCRLSQPAHLAPTPSAKRCVRSVTATPTLSSPAVRMRLSMNSAWPDS